MDCRVPSFLLLFFFFFFFFFAGGISRETKRGTPTSMLWASCFDRPFGPGEREKWARAGQEDAHDGPGSKQRQRCKDTIG